MRRVSSASCRRGWPMIGPGRVHVVNLPGCRQDGGHEQRRRWVRSGRPTAAGVPVACLRPTGPAGLSTAGLRGLSARRLLPARLCPARLPAGIRSTGPAARLRPTWLPATRLCPARLPTTRLCAARLPTAWLPATRLCPAWLPSARLSGCAQAGCDPAAPAQPVRHLQRRGRLRAHEPQGVARPHHDHRGRSAAPVAHPAGGDLVRDRWTGADLRRERGRDLDHRPSSDRRCPSLPAPPRSPCPRSC